VAPEITGSCQGDGFRSRQTREGPSEAHFICYKYSNAMTARTLSLQARQKGCPRSQQGKKKREKDTAYYLLGLFDVKMPLLFGQDSKKASLWLQLQISQGPKEA
jgi:hypothetical protein